MNRCFIKNVLISAVLFSLLSMTSACLADFRFVVMGDGRGDNEGINTEVLKAILERAKEDKPDFIVFVGDLITGSKHTDVHRDRLIKWKVLVEEFDIPVYIVVGNHEIESEMSEDTMRSVFEMPENGPAEFKELVYSFDYQNAHFVVLDTDQYENFHRLGSIQLEWLKNNLSETDKEFIFIFGHEPAFPFFSHKGSSLDRYPSERDKLWTILGECGASVYFCGHEHLYNRSNHDGIYQVISGGAGAPLHSNPEEGGFYHYIVIDVRDDSICEIEVKDLEGEVKDRFTIKL